MYRIAICDDEKSTCGELENYIKHYCGSHFKQAEIGVFYSGEALCEYLKRNEYFELLFLDIELPSINGVDVGQFIRKTLGNEYMDIVYISSKENYAMQLFQYRPLDFLIKPITPETIERILNAFVKRSGISNICLFYLSYKRGVFSF